MIVSHCLRTLLLAATVRGQDDSSVLTPAQVFVKNTSSVISAQKPNILSIQSQVDDIDRNQLTPVMAANAKILDSLHTIALILDEKSDMHVSMAKNRKFEAFLRNDINNNSIPTIKSGLVGLQDALLAQQVQLRAAVAAQVAARWEGIDTGLLANFTETLMNQTSTAIANVSGPIRQIEVYTNTTVPAEVDKGDTIETKLHEVLPTAWRNLQAVANKVEFIKDELERLESSTVPDRESNITADIMAEIADGVQTILAANAELEASTEGEMTKLVNQTYAEFNKQLNDMQTDMLSGLDTGLTAYQDQLTSMQGMATANADQRTRIQGLHDMLDERLIVIKQRKDALLQSILPHVAGFGASINASRDSLASTLNTFESYVNSTKDFTQSKIDAEKNRLVDQFVSGMDSMYGSIENKTMAAIAQAQATADAKVQAFSDSMNALTGQSGTRVDALRASKARIISQTGDVINTTSALFATKKQLIFNKIDAQFADLANSLQSRMAALNMTVSRLNSNYTGTLDAIRSALADGEADFGTFADAALDEIASNRVQRAVVFNESSTDLPSANITMGQDVIDQQAMLIDLANNLSATEAQLTAFKTGLASSIDAVWKKAYAFNETALIANLQSKSDANFTAQKDAAWQLLSVTVANLTNSSSFVGSQVDQLEAGIRSSFGALIDAAGGTGDAIASPIDTMLSTASNLLIQVRQNKDTLIALAQDMTDEFVRNKTSEDAAVDQMIAARMEAMRSAWSQKILSKLSPDATVASSMNDILNKIQAQLVYSDDASAYKGAIAAVTESLASLDRAMADGKDTIDSAYANLVRMSREGFTSVDAKLATLIDSSTKTVGDGSARVTAFKTQMNAAVDAAVAATKSAIMNKLKSRFQQTESAIHDYLVYVNSSVSDVQAVDSMADQYVSVSSLQLRNATAELASVYADAESAEESGKLKNIQIHRQLLNESKTLESVVSGVDSAAQEAVDDFNLTSLLVQSELIRNLSSFGEWVTHRLSQLDLSARDDVARANHTLSLRHRASELRNAKHRREIETGIASVVQALNKTELFEIVNELNRVNATLIQRAAAAHSVMTSVIDHLNGTSVSQWSTGDTPHLKELIQKYAGIISSITAKLPEFMVSEATTQEARIKGAGDEIKKRIEGHKFGQFDERKASDDLYKVQILEDMVSESRTKLQDSVRGLRKGKDFSPVMAELRAKVSRLASDRDTFRRDQTKKVERWLESRSEKLDSRA